MATQASVARPFFSSPGLQAGVSRETNWAGRFNGLPDSAIVFVKPSASCRLGKPPEGGCESSLASVDPGVNAWARKISALVIHPAETVP